MRNPKLSSPLAAVRLVVAASLVGSLAGAAHAQYDTNNPTFPGSTVSFELSPNLPIQLGSNTIADATFFGFDNSISFASITTTGTILTEHITYDAVVNGVNEAFTGTATINIKAESGVSAGVGTFDTAITALYVSNGNTVIALGTGGPTLGTSVVSLNATGPTYHVDNAFDIYTELSFDGGASFTQSNGSNHFSDFGGGPGATPEPVTMGLGIAGIAMAIRRVRRRSA